MRAAGAVRVAAGVFALWAVIPTVQGPRVHPTGQIEAAFGASTSCSRSWEIVPSPNSSDLDDNRLLAVSSSGPTDAWAVGFLGSGVGGFIGTLTLHWDGISWTVVPSPSPGAFSNVLFDVVAIAPNDAWAVGSFANTTSFRNRPLAMHWDGTGWAVVPASRPPMTVAELFGVDAVPADGVWAVGSSALDPGVDNRTLVETWTGSGWAIVPSPTTRSGVTRLAAVEALAPRLAWAVGRQGRIGHGRTLVERWSGRRWKAMPSPNVGSGVNELLAIAERNHRDLWAVGSFQTGEETTQALVEHFDGSTWRVVATPPLRGSGSLRAVAILSHHEVWAMGVREIPQLGTRPLAERWDGSSWQIVRMPRHPDSLGEELCGLAPDRDGGLWAVGTYRDPVKGLSRTFIEHRCGR